MQVWLDTLGGIGLALTFRMRSTYNDPNILLGETMFSNQNRWRDRLIVAWVLVFGFCGTICGTMGVARAITQDDPLAPFQVPSGSNSKKAGGFSLGLPQSAEPYEITATYEIDRSTRKGKLHVTVELFDGYHIFSTTQGPGGPIPTTIKIAEDWANTTGPFVPNAPAQIELNSEFFPNIAVEQHVEIVTWTAPILFTGPMDKAPGPLSIVLQGQVCEKNCIPIRDAKAEATFSGFIEPAAEVGKLGEFHERDSAVEWKIRLNKRVVKPGESLELVLEATPDPEYHIYKLDPQDDVTENRTLLVLTQKAGTKAEEPKADKKIVRKDMGVAGTVEFYEGPVTFRVPINVPDTANEGETPLEGLIGYQGCTNGACDRPRGLSFSVNYEVSRSQSDNKQAPALIKATDYQSVAKHPLRRTWIDAAKYSLTMEPKEIFAKFCLAMLAGLILNVMPCVLPVIGLKILGFVNEAHGDRRKASLLTLVYAAGMIGFVLAFGFTSIAVRSFTNQTLGWGSQFGNTTFQILITSFMFALALSFLGVWEFPIPGFATGAKSTELSTRQGVTGAFAKGVITTLLATPCSGPFLGSALAVSLTQPAWVVILIFLGVGLGMASPYLAIAAFPSALKFIPKPGPWMETFKEFLAFPLLLSVVAFVAGFPSIERIPMLASLIFVWFACWLIGRVPVWASPSEKLRGWSLGAAAAFAGTLGSFYMLGTSPYELPWEPFSEQRLQQLASEGKTVMVDFTADWCQNCKYNLAVAVHTRKVQKMVKENDVVPLIADLTRHPPDLWAKLHELNSISIPVMAFYPPGETKNPIVLQDVLAESDVLTALEKAGPSRNGEKNARPASLGSTEKAEIR